MSADGDRSPVAAAADGEPSLLLVTAFLEGESLSISDRQADQGEPRSGQACRVLQAGARLPAAAAVPGDVDVHPAARKEDRSSRAHRRAPEVPAEWRAGDPPPAAPPGARQAGGLDLVARAGVLPATEKQPAARRPGPRPPPRAPATVRPRPPP